MLRCCRVTALRIQANALRIIAIALKFDGWQSLELAAACHLWDGVMCNEQGDVVSIILTKRGLSGSLPPLFSRLPRLRALFLSENELRGASSPPNPTFLSGVIAAVRVGRSDSA